MTAERYPRLLLLAALLGVPAATAAVLLTAALHQVQHLVWVSLPHALELSAPPWWLVLLVPTLGGAIVALAVRLPGHAGHAASDGLALDPVPAAHLPGILLAAAGSISLGLVIGPEAPLVALGLALGLAAGQILRRDGQELAVLAFAGAFATLSTAFGGPLPSALLLFEIVAMTGAQPSAALGRLLLPGFLAAGVGSLVFTGVGDWSGVQTFVLSIPGLPDYPTVRVVDLAWSIPVAIVAALISVGVGAAIQRGAARVGSCTAVQQQRALVAGGLAVGLLAVGFRAATDRSVDFVLFSGSTNLGATLLESSGLVLAGVILVKGLAFVITVAVGFRGGLIFPTVTLGASAGVLAALWLPGLELTPAVIAAIAAASAAALRAPFFGAVLAALLAGPASADTIPIAIIAAVLGWLVAMRFAPPAGAADPAAPAPAAAAPAP